MSRVSHAAGTESLALCGNDATPDQIVSDDEATCWECNSITDVGGKA